MRERRFMQVDVFSSSAFKGNPLAVVVDGEGLSDAQMQAFARWTNLSETTFLLPTTQPGADYRLRIFTPSNELPFAGHPTLGTCHAWLQSGGKPQREGIVIQECAKGLVPIRVDYSNAAAPLAFAAPSSTRKPFTEEQLAAVLAAMGLQRDEIVDCALLDNGPLFWALLLRDPDRVMELVPDSSALYAIRAEVGFAAKYAPQNDALIGRSSREARAFERSAADDASDIEVRVFFNATTTAVEDPITGSFNASFAQWMIDAGHIEAPYVAAQGTCIDRDGRVHVSRDAQGQVWIGGASHTLIQGKVTL
ncbi:PhzF family phenazine biosynthesis protein [Diaphorobacter sp. HDW4A]|uniref:PhzF family phenazine biosynthesis protein n=1 Tax=Diaphorobacter sp. HDW4A TaxID=2714924 RepID=UPI001409F734|nr:PhzF family phenazine biosynthesis protein [Diaphorobacter sp. HDW4A]QIL83236.1 PhzF family phenazine biosynthesis protein [Diaphorobacter sp. HDW4A]